MQSPKPRNAHRLGHLWSFFLPVYFLAAAAFDSTEVTNREYLKFVLSTRQTTPEYWNNGRFPSGQENEPVVLVNFHEATAYCRFVGKRLPTVEEWKSTCEGGKLKKRGDIWEWTSTDVAARVVTGRSVFVANVLGERRGPPRQSQPNG